MNRTERLIGEAILFPEKQEENLNKVLIHHLVCTEMFCPVCKNIMDSKKASLFTIIDAKTGKEQYNKAFCGRDCLVDARLGMVKGLSKLAEEHGYQMVVKEFHQQKENKKQPIKKIFSTIRPDASGFIWIAKNADSIVVGSGAEKTITACQKHIAKIRKENGQ